MREFLFQNKTFIPEYYPRIDKRIEYRIGFGMGIIKKI